MRPLSRLGSRFATRMGVCGKYPASQWRASLGTLWFVAVGAQAGSFRLHFVACPNTLALQFLRAAREPDGSSFVDTSRLAPARPERSKEYSEWFCRGLAQVLHGFLLEANSRLFPAKSERFEPTSAATPSTFCPAIGAVRQLDHSANQLSLLGIINFIYSHIC